ncbi:MAG TPA: Gfo/Idh/MocA family oxidoreductase [Vicinamibacterales bacterium]|jgi:predicted dehydrogenase|nr:Gfo/Idh/MocA family oxidoreductase [Vicinamibacterales bacterium]
MARKVIGLVGCGLWGTLVLRDLSSLDAAVVVADTDDAARASATALGATAVRDAGALPDVDALVVATPAVTHADIVDALLPRGVPLLVEKPFTTSIVDAERLVARGGDRLFVGHVWRYHPGVEQLGEIARSGDIGPIAGVRSTRTNWTSPRTDVDSIWNLAPHDLTLAIEIVGGIPAPRAALAEVQDGRAVGLIALLGDTPWLAFDVSNRYRDKRREVRVHGRDGVAVMRDPDAGQIEITRGDARTRTTPAIEVRHVSRESALRRQLAAFLGVLDGGPPPKSTAAEGLDVVKAVVRLRALAGLEN